MEPFQHKVDQRKRETSSESPSKLASRKTVLPKAEQLANFSWDIRISLVGSNKSSKNEVLENRTIMLNWDFAKKVISLDPNNTAFLQQKNLRFIVQIIPDIGVPNGPRGEYNTVNGNYTLYVSKGDALTRTIFIKGLLFGVHAYIAHKSQPLIFRGDVAREKIIDSANTSQLLIADRLRKSPISSEQRLGIELLTKQPK